MHALDIVRLLWYLVYMFIPAEKYLSGLVRDDPDDTDTIQALAQLGVRTNLQLLQQGHSPLGRSTLAEQSGLSVELILQLVNRADFSARPGPARPPSPTSSAPATPAWLSWRAPTQTSSTPTFLLRQKHRQKPQAGQRDRELLPHRQDHPEAGGRRMRCPKHRFIVTFFCHCEPGVVCLVKQSSPMVFETNVLAIYKIRPGCFNHLSLSLGVLMEVSRGQLLPCFRYCIKFP